MKFIVTTFQNAMYQYVLKWKRGPVHMCIVLAVVNIDLNSLSNTLSAVRYWGKAYGLWRCGTCVMYIIILTGSMTPQKYCAACMLINEIPIEIRNISGEANVLKRTYLTRWWCMSLSTNFRLWVAYHHIILKTSPVAVIMLAKVITITMCEGFAVRSAVK